ncbi:MAG: MMPL family transporter [Dehalococcoidia bacterium]|nr:MMPL family transporter [Dehalococcoidia bacterium]
MRRFLSTRAVAGGAVRHPWLTVLLWVMLLGAAFVSAGSLGDVLSDNNNVSGSSEAARAQRLIDGPLADPNAPGAHEYVLVEAQGHASADSMRQTVASVAEQLRGTANVRAVHTYLDGEAGFITDDGQVAMLIVDINGDSNEAKTLAEPVVATVASADTAADGYRITTVGEGSVNAEFEDLAKQTLERGEMVGLGIGLVILLVVFGAAVAAGLPVLLALASIVLALGTTALVGRALDLSTFVTNIITMIGLAVGIDYSLFIVQRFREERSLGLARDEAIRTAAATATRAVFVSGIAVVIALSGLLIMPDATFRAFGIGAILVVIAAVLAALTLLPAVLRLLGDRVNWLTLPVIGRRRSPENEGGVWGFTTRLVTARPVFSVIVAGGLLLGAASAVGWMQLGSNGISSLPETSNGRHAFEVLTSRFDSAAVITADLVIQARDVHDPAVQSAIERFEGLAAADSFYGAPQLRTDAAGELALLSLPVLDDPASAQARDALDRVRDDYIPQAFSGSGATVLVGGATATEVDSVAEIRHYTPIVFGVVLGFSFLLLTMVFRSIVVPLKAVAMNLLSVGAAYGMIVLVFQKGIGAERLGFHQMPVIESWLPLFLFSILFGLSMDYHVFLLSRIKERYDETGDNRHAVEHGLRSTGSIITGAALIMVSVFGGFALGDLAMFQQMGFGLAVAVIVDATIVRSVLVPATMELLGDWNWYFPGWLAWLPNLEIEGRRPAAQSTRTPAVLAEAGDGGA